MQNDIEARLGRIRGPVPPKRHNARTIAAVTTNPGCSRRALLDTAGVDKEKLARHIGFPAQFGQSGFAIARGNAFESLVKENGCAALLRLLREVLGLELTEVAYADLNTVGGNDAHEARHSYARSHLARAATDGDDAGTLFDHPLLRLEIAGQDVYLEPDLVAFQHGGVFHVVEIKSFPVIDGHADPAKVAAAAVQSAVYVLALRQLLGQPRLVSDHVVLVCPKDFSNQPTAVRVDVRKQLASLAYQLGRLERIESTLEPLPPNLTFDLAPDRDGRPTRPAAELVAALGQVTARYAPDCLSTCDLGFFCRDEASGCTDTLGRNVREQLGGVETVEAVLGLAEGRLVPADDQVPAAYLLRAAAQVYDEIVAGHPGGGNSASGDPGDGCPDGGLGRRWTA